MSNYLWKVMEAAAKVAETSEACDFRMAALVVRRREIISVGANLLYYKCDKKRAGVHAEKNALMRVENTTGTILFVIRVNPSGKWMLSRPCADCRKLIRKLKVKKVYYSINNNTIAMEWVNRNLPRKKFIRKNEN